MPPQSREHAQATVTVTDSRRIPFDESENPQLVEIQITESFAGGIEGSSVVRALEIAGGDGEASLVTLQRVVGRLAGRSGSFVLQGQGTVEHGHIKVAWHVVPGSGTAQLRGLRGEGGFEGEFGKGSQATLDLWFE